MKNTIIALVFLIPAFRGQSQVTDSAGLQIKKDARIDFLLKKQAQINKISGYKSSSGQYKGFRIMILNTNNRELAYKTKSELLSRFTDQNVYMSYQAPYYKIKIGDFIKMEDAEKFRKQLTGFSQGVFVIQDLIKIKPEDEARLLKEEENQL